MMVAESEWSDVWASWREVFYHLLRRCNARKQQYVTILAYTVERLLPAAEHGSDIPVFKTREEQSLEGIEVHRLGDDPELHRFEVVRAFGDNNYVGPVLAAERFAQSSCRQEFVVDDQSMIVNEQDVDSRFDIAVLEGIIEQYHVDTVLV